MSGFLSTIHEIPSSTTTTNNSPEDHDHVSVHDVIPSIRITNSNNGNGGLDHATTNGFAAAVAAAAATASSPTAMMEQQQQQEGNCSQSSDSNGGGEKTKSLSKVEKGQITMTGGDRLHCRYWKPVDAAGRKIKPKALVCICHGLSEHLDCYSELASFLVENGDFMVFGHDLPGHGLSDGKRGLINDVESIVEYVLHHVIQMKAKHRGIPLFMFGHSLGGLVAIQACLHNPGLFRGCILEGPLIDLKDEYKSLPLHMALKCISLLAPEFPLLPISHEEVTSNALSQRRLQEDPLRVKGGVRARTMVTLIEGSRDTYEALKKFRVPFLILHGELDELCLPEGSQEMHEVSLETTDKTVMFVQGAKHHLLLEGDEVKGKLMSEALGWIKQRIN